MITVIYKYRCGYCKNFAMATFDLSLNEEIPKFSPPDNWSILDNDLICNEHEVKVKPVDLAQAHIDMYNIDLHDFGISLNELTGQRKHHNKVFFDKFGIPWKYKEGVLWYNNYGYRKNYKFLPGKDWEKANMGASELPYMQFFTPEEFETIKPSYL